MGSPDAAQRNPGIARHVFPDSISFHPGYTRLPTLAERQQAHLRLAGYFQRRELGPRKVDELPWQQFKASAWEELSRILSDLSFLNVAFERNQFDVKQYWAALQAASSIRANEVYLPALQHPSGPNDALRRLAILLHDMGYVQEARALREHLVTAAREANDPQRLLEALRELGISLKLLGKLDAAMQRFREEEQLCRNLGDQDSLAACLGNQASIHYQRGDLTTAETLLHESVSGSRNRDWLQRSLGNLGNVLLDRRKFDDALAAFEEKERICRELGQLDDLANAVHHQANVFYERGSLDQALEKHQEAEMSWRGLGNKAGIALTTAAQARAWRKKGDHSKAEDLLQIAAACWRELGQLDKLSDCLVHLGNLQRDRRAYTDAQHTYQDAERAACEAQYNYGMATAIEGQAVVLWYTANRVDALTVFKRQEEILVRLEAYPQELAFCLYNQAMVCKEQGKLQEALNLHEREAEQYRQMNHVEWFACCLDMQADLLQQLDRKEDAGRVRAEASRVRQLNMTSK